MSYWNTEIKDRALAMRREGKTLREIAESLDSNTSQIGWMCWDIPHPNRPKKKPASHTVRNPHTNCWQCGIALAGAPWGGRFCRTCNHARSHHSGREAAGTAVAKAIRAKDLPHPRTLQCTDCPRPAEEYDHRDYNKPLDVQPVCRKCNARRGPGKWVQFKPVRDLIAERRVV